MFEDRLRRLAGLFAAALATVVAALVALVVLLAGCGYTPIVAPGLDAVDLGDVVDVGEAPDLAKRTLPWGRPVIPCCQDSGTDGDQDR